MVFYFTDNNDIISTDNFYLRELSDLGKKECAEQFFGQLYLPATFGFSQEEYYLDEDSYDLLREYILTNKNKVLLSVRDWTITILRKEEIKVAKVIADD